MWYREFYPRSRPRQAKGGIKAQSRRFGESWWAKRWLEVLESFDIRGRLERGRSYARRGQVVAIDVDKGVVKAKVQGSRPKPYDITIKVKTLSAAEWTKVKEAVAGQALFAAKLLAGEMPQDIEQVFHDVKLSLFPRKSEDLDTECSCPDWSNPCKHIAAVYYLLGEEFDRDPFLIFKLRGQSREDLLRGFGQAPRKPKRSKAAHEPTADPGEVLPADAARFWPATALPDDFFGPVESPPVPAALPKRLGNFPFWRGSARLLDVLEPIYRRAGQRGLALFLGENAV